MLAQLKLAGAPPDVIERARESAARAKRGPDVVEVWSDCAQAWECFQRLLGQWAFTGGMQIMRTGLPSNRVESSMRLWGIPARRRKQLFEDITIMERAVLTADREARERRAAQGD